MSMIDNVLILIRCLLNVAVIVYNDNKVSYLTLKATHTAIGVVSDAHKLIRKCMELLLW